MQARECLGNDVETVGMRSFEDVFVAVANGDVLYGFLPIENSLGGSIHANYDLLVRHQLSIVGEHHFRVRHSLMALPGTGKDQVRRYEERTCPQY